jgi:hypothetical protein
LLGTLFLLAFIVIRAASFHHVDVALRDASAGMRLNGLLELGGIASIGGASLYIHKRERPQLFRRPPLDLGGLRQRLRRPLPEEPQREGIE